MRTLRTRRSGGLLQGPPRETPGMNTFPFVDEKGAEQRWNAERYGRIERGPPLHPWTHETGRKGASNVGQDETSGSD